MDYVIVGAYVIGLFAIAIFSLIAIDMWRK